MQVIWAGQPSHAQLFNLDSLISTNEISGSSIRKHRIHCKALDDVFSSSWWGSDEIPGSAQLARQSRMTVERGTPLAALDLRELG